MYPQINDQSSIIERIIMHFPSELVVKFIHRSSIIDVNYNIQLTTTEYQQLYITKLYDDINSIYIMIPNHTNYIVMFNYNVHYGDIIHTLIDSTNNIIHFNSNNKLTIQEALHNLCKQGFIPIHISDTKTKIIKKIFNLKYYNMYHLGGGMIYKNSSN